MAFKKLNTTLLEKMGGLGIETPTDLQKAAISKIKSGVNLFVLGPKESGKTEALIIAVLNKLKMDAVGDNPRAIIFAKDRKAVMDLADKFKRYTEYSDLRIKTIIEEHHIDRQKDEVYLGADVVIGTPKRMAKLYFLNGLNLMELEMLIVEDAEFLITGSMHTDINRISESVGRCQHIVFADKADKLVPKLTDLFMENAQLVYV